MNRTRLLQVLFVAGLVAGTAPAHATEVALTAVERVYVPGDVFVMPVRLASVSECVNAVSATISFDTRYLHAEDIGRGNSILTLWTQEPAIDAEAGTVHFSGGIPGGYCGRLQGDPGLTNILLEVVFRVRDIQEERAVTAVTFAESIIHAHDGKGTLVPVTAIAGNVEIHTNTDIPPRNEWIERVREDRTAPELFEVILHSDPNVARGRYYIIFSTTDKQSGVSHYEVLETDPRRWGFLTWISREANWNPAESPYVLRDQSLRSVIQVKAVDKAGNERVVTYEPPAHLRGALHWSDVVAMFLLGVVCVSAGALLAYWYRRREHARLSTTHDV